MGQKSSWLSLAGFGALTAVTAAVGGQVTARNKEWYRALDKPSFQPPEWVFGPVWTGLYALMSVSAMRVWKAPSSPARTRALALWGIQLAANAAWSPLFFGAHKPKLALADMAVMVASVVAYTNEARKVDKSAAWMMAPYLAWLGFAGLLNEEVVRRNP